VLQQVAIPTVDIPAHRETTGVAQYSDCATGRTIRGLNPGKVGRVFSSVKRPEWLWGSPDEASLKGVKGPECDVDRSPPSDAEV